MAIYHSSISCHRKALTIVKSHSLRVPYLFLMVRLASSSKDGGSHESSCMNLITIGFPLRLSSTRLTNSKISFGKYSNLLLWRLSDCKFRNLNQTRSSISDSILHDNIEKKTHLTSSTGMAVSLLSHKFKLFNFFISPTWGGMASIRFPPK